VNPTTPLMWFAEATTRAVQHSTTGRAEWLTGTAVSSATAASECTRIETAEVMWQDSHVVTGATVFPVLALDFTRSPIVSVHLAFNGGT
jgi:hypothetical protein